MVEQPSVRQRVRDELAGIGFDPVHQDIRERIEWIASANGLVAWQDLLDQFVGQDTQKVVSALMFSEFDRMSDDLTRYVEDSLDTILTVYWEGELKGVLDRMRHDASMLDKATQDELFSQYQQISSFIKERKNKRSSFSSATRSSAGEK
jgi:hypothetical protein